jgi:hypothetical protein
LSKLLDFSNRGHGTIIVSWNEEASERHPVLGDERERSARTPMTLFGITKRTISGSPCKISQSASNIIPTDMLSLLF